MSTYTVIYDELGEFAWDFIETQRDENGEITSVFTGYDDGTTRFQDFDNGVLRFEELTDLSPMGGPSDVKSWERIEFNYDANGELETRFETKDDGVTELKSYEGGTLRTIQMADLGVYGDASDARIWETYDRYYDVNGEIEAQYKVLDNGVTILTEYENGVRRKVTQTDLTEYGDTSDVKSWESIETYYDQNGVIEANYRVNDDGTTYLMEYENGVRRFLTQTDLTEYGTASDAKSWESIQTGYDSNGVVEVTFRKNDDGTTQLTEYENGVRRMNTQTDLTEMGEASDVKNWETIQTAYDANGVIELKFVTRDSGVTNLMEYENGVLRFRTDEDRGPMGETSGVKDWDNILTVYDETGQRELQQTFYDNQDVLAFVFEDGARALKLEYDGDESDTWLVRETFYNDAGQVTAINTYDALEDVPPEYGVGQWDMTA